jgi:hypothetical protein
MKNIPILYNAGWMSSWTQFLNFHSMNIERVSMTVTQFGKSSSAKKAGEWFFASMFADVVSNSTNIVGRVPTL